MTKRTIIKKIKPEYLDAIEDGSKTFEVRDEDGDKYAVGDTLELVEWKDGRFGEESAFTGRQISIEITYTLAVGKTNFGDNTVILGFRKLNPPNLEKIVADLTDEGRIRASEILLWKGRYSSLRDNFKSMIEGLGNFNSALELARADFAADEHVNPGRRG